MKKGDRVVKSEGIIGVCDMYLTCRLNISNPYLTEKTRDDCAHYASVVRQTMQHLGLEDELDKFVERMC